MIRRVINRIVCRFLHIEEKVFFNRPYKIKGFNTLDYADSWLCKYEKPMNLIQMCKVSDISEEEANRYVACCDAGYIYSFQSLYYSKASRALKDAIRKKYCVVYI
jgi:hypothetical protein